nr:acyltransferase family protein [Lachnospiraceae bacterium]
MRKPGRDYTVELWRFIFCIVVLGFHFCAKINFKFLGAGYLAVEFFFILSGYGIYSYYSRYMEKEKFAGRWYRFGCYIGNRIAALYPMYLLSLILMFCFMSYSRRWGIGQMVSYMKMGWAEFLLLQCGSLAKRILIVPHWYVAALFWGSLLVLLLLMVCGKTAGYIFCPFLSIFIYAYYYRMIGKIDITYSHHAVLRAAAGLMLGVFIGFVLRFVRKWIYRWPEKWRKVLYVCGNGLMAGILVYMMFGRRGAGDFAVICVFTLALLAVFASEILLSTKKKALFQRLSSWTYPIYLFQMPVLECIFYFIS